MPIREKASDMEDLSSDSDSLVEELCVNCPEIGEISITYVIDNKPLDSLAGEESFEL
jgi:hypothetical protein